MTLKSLLQDYDLELGLSISKRLMEILEIDHDLPQIMSQALKTYMKTGVDLHIPKHTLIMTFNYLSSLCLLSHEYHQRMDEQEPHQLLFSLLSQESASYQASL